MPPKIEGPKDTVDTPSLAYQEMATKWPLIHDLKGGTPAMRNAGERWLPREPREQPAAWELRRSRSFLYGAYADTVQRVVSRPFSKPITLQGDLPEPLVQIEDDVDRTGQDLTQFMRHVFERAVDYGLTHVLVDFPTVAPGATLADERAQGVRPTFVHVPPPNLIGWRSETTATGDERLTQVRIHETKVELAGKFREIEVEYIRVITAPAVDTETGESAVGTWELWRKTEDEEDFSPVQGGTHTYPGIPLVTFYTNRTGVLSGTPPLEDLAWLNIAHWQSSSDQRNILRFARVGLLFLSGITEEEYDEGVTVGPNQLIRTTNSEARMEYVEHRGSAIQSGERDLTELREQMEVLGLQPFLQRTGTQTATGAAIDEARQQTDVLAWVRTGENFIAECYRVAGEWVKTELPEEFKADINSDFGIGQRAAEDIKALIAMRAAGEITRETFLIEIKRRGLLSDAVDIEEEIENLEDEMPDLTSFVPPDDGDDDDDDPDDDPDDGTTDGVGVTEGDE